MQHRLTFRRYLLWLAVALPAIVILYWLVGTFVLRTPTSFTIATGRQGGAYYQYAQAYAEQLAELGITVNIVESAGTVETLSLLNRRSVDVGFVQSGVAGSVVTEGLYSLGSIFYEPIWIFYHPERFAEPVEYLTQLEGKRIAIGEIGSGTNVLAQELLGQNGVTAANSTWLQLPAVEGADQLRSGDVDALFLVLAPSSVLVADLLADTSLSLMNMRRARAYVARYSFLSDTIIGEGTVDLARNVPSEDKTILLTTATLVANEQLHPDSARQLLTAAIDVHRLGGLLEEEGEFPSPVNSEFPVPMAVETFLEVGPTGLERYLPVSVAGLIERIFIYVVPLAVLLFPLLRSTPIAYRFANQYRVFRWYGQVRKAEEDVDSFDLDEIERELAYLSELEKRLTEKVRVPLFFQRDFYNLRLHLRLVSDRLEARKAHLLRGDGSHHGSDAIHEEIMIRLDADERTMIQ